MTGGNGAPHDGVFVSTLLAIAPLDRCLRALFPAASWNEVRRLIRGGKVRVDGALVLTIDQPVSPGSKLDVRLAARRPRTDALPSETIVHLDAYVVVANKPANIATVPYEDERDTFDRLLAAAIRKTKSGGSTAPLGVVQRLDKETSGLLVFARTSSAKKNLQAQLRARTMHRRYLALVHGHVESRTIRSFLVKNRGDGLRGSTKNNSIGREAVTHVTSLKRLGGATLVECRLETGRTHQIRIHLAEAGHPLLGERVYGRRYEGPRLVAPRVMLHASELGFTHPHSGEPLRFSSRPPGDFERTLGALPGAG